MKSLFNNLLKGAYVAYQSEETRVIDSNALLALKIEQAKAAASALDAGFVGGIGAERLELSPEGAEEEPEYDEEGNLLPSSSSVIKISQMPDIKQLLEEANAQAEEILKEARQEAEALKLTAVGEGRNEGFQSGYQEGRERALGESQQKEEELNSRRKELEREYEEQFSSLEAELIVVLSDIFRHIFQVEFADRKNVISYLLQQAVYGIDMTKDAVIHVSKEDYGFISMQKKQILSGIANSEHIEITEDMTLSAGQCMIETGGGIFDCSVGTQLEGLVRELKLLSRR